MGAVAGTGKHVDTAGSEHRFKDLRVSRLAMGDVDFGTQLIHVRRT